jgi:hypothetical protein
VLTSGPVSSLPDSYKAFQTAWEANVREAEARDESAKEAEMPGNEGGEEMPDDVQRFFEARAPAKDVETD